MLSFKLSYHYLSSHITITCHPNLYVRADTQQELGPPRVHGNVWMKARQVLRILRWSKIGSKYLFWLISPHNTSVYINAQYVYEKLFLCFGENHWKDCSWYNTCPSCLLSSDSPSSIHWICSYRGIMYICFTCQISIWPLLMEPFSDIWSYWTGYLVETDLETEFPSSE